MAIIAEWELHCNLCDSPVCRSMPMKKPKWGEVLVAQHWVLSDGTEINVGDSFFCNSCQSGYRPMIEHLHMFRFVGDDQE